MRRKLFVRKLRKGVSDLIIILALVAIAIPIMLTVQHWLSSQTGRVTSYVTIPSLYATVLSKSKTDTVQTIAVKIENKGSETYSVEVNKISVVLSNGTVINANGQILAGSKTLAPGSSTVILVKVNTVSSISSIVFELVNSSTGNKETLSVSL
ncbi:MAG: hypothetical protein B6U85_09180 [Desulfurococcales archaeon ex4484_42]|nr:MAG: hypothetical protein B6U85_09180 [Desulfurococcales archaeon ex4484_42]